MQRRILYNFGKNKTKKKTDKMKQKLLGFIKNLLPHLLIVFLFFILTVAYFSPAFEGKVLQQMDVEHSIALSHQTKELYQKTGHYSPWNGSLFGGMPNYQIYDVKKPSIYNFKLFLFHILPYYSASIFFLYLIGFYLLLLTFRLDKWLSAIMATAFALSSYNIIIIAVGHITKAYALAIMPLVLASFILIYEYRNYLWGGLALVFSLGLQISTSHIQIVYYTAMLAGSYVIYKFIIDLKNKELNKYWLSTLVAIIATILSLLPNTQTLWTAYEISKYSIRGGQSELKTEGKNAKQSKGLDKDYALAWSYGVGESLSLFIPNVKGGPSDYIGNDPKLMSKINSQFKQYIAQQSRYWGPQPFTAGPVYFGAVIIFLFVLGMFIIKNKIKWWILAATILSIMLAWGKHFPLLTDLFYYYFPYYNKFRVVSMILVVASLTVPLFAAMTVYEIMKNPEVIKQNKKGFSIALIITAGVALLVYLFPKITGPLLTPQESEFLKNVVSTQGAQAAAQYREFFNDLESVRAMIVKADAFRSLVFVLLTAALLWGYSLLKEKKAILLLSGLAVLILVDLWTVDRRYLNYENFKPKRLARTQFTPTPADKFIMKTNQLNYRVLNLTRDPFNDAITSYYHNSIGGYSAAKLRRYQDIIEYYLYPYSQMIVNALRDTTGTVNMMQVLKPMQVLHMLNTLYIIVNPNSVPIVNPYAYGNAWFVDGYKFVNSAKEEIEALSQVDLRRYAVINKKKFGNIQYPELSIMPDTTRYIKLVRYMPDSLVYECYTPKDGFAVFSEIYYPEGWELYIDGKPAPIVNVDYILRGAVIPAGKHQLVMVFKPKSYYLGRKITKYSSIFIGLIFIIALAFTIKKGLTTSNNEKDEA